MLGNLWKLRQDEFPSLSVTSNVWLYRRGREAVAATFDGPFLGWHELTVCYEGRGWQVVDRVVREPKADRQSNLPPWKYVEVTLRKTTGEFGHLFFSVVDGEGREVPPSEMALSLVLWNLNYRWRRLGESSTYQMGFFYENASALSPRDRSQLATQHLQSRRILRSELFGGRGDAP